MNKFRSLRIGIDFDGVLVMSGEFKSFCAKILFGIDIQPELFKKYFVAAKRDTGGGRHHQILTEEQYQRLRDYIYRDKDTAYRLKPVAQKLKFNGGRIIVKVNSFDYVRALALDGHKLFCVTSHQGMGLKIAKRCLKINQVPIECHGAGYENTKLALARKLKLDVYLDDDVYKLEPLIGVVPNLFLLDWGYNRHIQCDPKFIRRLRWPDFYWRVYDIANQ